MPRDVREEVRSSTQRQTKNILKEVRDLVGRTVLSNSHKANDIAQKSNLCQATIKVFLPRFLERIDLRRQADEVLCVC